jgi:hypothetical protein
MAKISFRKQAEDLFYKYGDVDAADIGIGCDETIKEIEKQFLDVYTLALQNALKAIDKWSEVPAFPTRFNKK